MEKPFRIVGIGASAGGLQALQEFFQHIPAEPDLAFVVATHLIRDYRSQLDGILARSARVPVFRVTDEMPIENNRIYVMPENVTMTIRGERLLLKARASQGVNRAIDIFFLSLARQHGDRAVGIILSGNDSDGARGSACIHKRGGRVFVQAPESSAFSRMPWAAIHADHPEVISTPAALAHELVKGSAAEHAPTAPAAMVRSSR